MFLKKIILFAAAAILAIGFSGCSVFETDTEALMNPPVFSEEQEKLNAALTEVIGESYVLKYPETGEMNSAFIFRDLDSDGIEEAMAFYSLLDESTRINILKKKNDDWVSVYEAAGFYGDIQRVDFAVIDSKGCAVVVEWEQEAAIYRYEDERLVTVHKTECEGINIADIDGNGFSEILVFSGSSIGRTVLNIVHSINGKIEVTRDLALHASHSGIYSAFEGKLSDDKNAYFIDSVIYDGVYLTEILTLENGEAKRSFVADYVEYEEEEEEEEEGSGIIVIIGGDYGKRGIFLRNTKIPCLDTNKDGITEMPVEVREDYAQEASKKVFFIRYMQYDGTKSVPVWNGVANTEGGYMFRVPESWNDETTASFSSSGSELVIKNNKTGETILVVNTALKNDYQDKYEDFVLASEDETKNYYIKSFTEEGSKFYLSPETYSDCFIFI